MSSADNTAGAASPALGGGASGWREATKLIREIGLKMSLPTTVVCTSLALYHRFIAGPASDQLDSGLVAMAVVYLASKAEEVRDAEVQRIHFDRRHPTTLPAQPFPTHLITASKLTFTLGSFNFRTRGT